MTRDDPILGLVRLCSSCDEWWPADAEFFRDGRTSCRACDAEYDARRRRLTQRIGRSSKEVEFPVPGHCNRPLRHDARCGRRPGHANVCRSYAAMRAQADRKATMRKAA